MKRYRILKAVQEVDEYKIQWSSSWFFFSFWFDVTAPTEEYGGKVDYFGMPKPIKDTVTFGSLEAAKHFIKLKMINPPKKRWEVLDEVVSQEEAKEWRN